jgi:hypothetical protein
MEKEINLYKICGGNTMFTKSTKISLYIVASLIIILLSIPVTLLTQEKSPLYSITREELRDHIFFLASDELEGRDTGSEGFAIGALYAVSQFKQSGLEPLIVGKDGKRTFFQDVPFISYYVGKNTALTISSDAGEIKLFHPDKMLLFQNQSVEKNILVDEHPVFLGYGIDDPAIGWSDYNNVDVRGKVVFIVGGAPSKNGKPLFPPDVDEFYRNFGKSANLRVVSAMKHGASAIFFVPDPEMAKNWSYFPSSLIRKQFSLLLEVNQSAENLAIFIIHPDAVAEMLKNAGYSWTYGDYDYKPAILENIRVSCTVARDEEKAVTCKNIIAMLPGTDPKLKDEYIVVNAHLDHLGINSGGEVMNGADDDASGCAVVLEVAEALAMKPAKRSFIFVLFTGEERGALGSEWFISNPPVPKEQIVLGAAVDMVGRKSRDLPDAIFIVADGEGKESLLDIAKRTNESTIKADIDFSLNKRDLEGHIMRCDLKSFMTKGIPSVLFTRGFMPPNYHSSDDDAETLNYNKVEKAARLLYLLLEEVGNR